MEWVKVDAVPSEIYLHLLMLSTFFLFMMGALRDIYRSELKEY